ncbi:multicomponent Na+:H+ antiporter subunit E [Nitrosospira briensis]|uniref:Multicomponent Na+:H+ antiporter subunit E n=1 Tax=Nitrosospira briensis TaxID=35799 RepID=A0A1I4YWR5_9PROT|nr:Na+/H+ antiporter subunit E [Nitrosospira briensis]SFN42496.1 multicomponent Na+:H+ antiporter subunit E [Nitrosospira briensis]
MILGAILWRSVLLAMLWCILAEGNVGSWGVGAISTALALAASLAVLPVGAIRFSPLGLVFFLIYFISKSFRAGVRVALLAVQPRLDIHPGIETVSLRLPNGVGRVILINTINLLPGTLVLGLNASTLQLHVLDMRSSIEGEIRIAEKRIAKMLGLSLDQS